MRPKKKVLQTNPKLANSRLDRILEITEIAATMEAHEGNVYIHWAYVYAH